MNNTRLGLCVTANMRLRIDVRPFVDQSHSIFDDGNEPNVLLVHEKALKLEKLEKLEFKLSFCSLKIK